MAETYQDVHGRRAVPVGGGKDLPLVRALEGHLTTLAGVQREVRNSASDLKIVHERTVRMQDTIASLDHQSGALVAAISDSISAAANAVIEKVKPALDSAVRTAELAAVSATKRLDATNRPAGWVPPPVGKQAAPMGTAENPVVVTPAEKQTPVSDPSSRTPTTRHLDPRATGAWHPAGNAPGEQGVANADAWSQGRQFGIGELRQSLGRAIGKGLQDAGRPPAELVQNSKGEWQHRGEGGHFGAKATEEEVKDFSRKVRTRRIMANYGGSITEAGSLGKGVMNALPGVIGKSLGVAGAAYTIGKQVWDFAGKQVEANREWTAITGGNQADAFRERAEGRKFRMQQTLMGGPGGMSGAQADQLFKGVAGINPGDRSFRQDALELGAENFRKFGMSINDSLELVQMSAENGSKNLNAVAEALDGVTKSAKDAGLNTEKARKSFSATYAAALPNVQGSGTAAGVSSALVSAQQGLGEQYAGLDNSGSFSTQNMRMLAAQRGQSLSQFISGNQGQQGALRITQSIQAQTKNMSDTLLGDSGRQIIAQYRQENGLAPNAPLDEDQAKEVAQRIMQSPGAPDPGHAADLIGRFGGPAGLTANDSVAFLVSSTTGGYNPEQKQRDAMKSSQMHKVDLKGLAGSKDEMAAIGWNKNQVNMNSGTTAGWITSQDTQARKQYFEQQKNKKSGIYSQRSPIIEKMLKQGNENQRFKIKVVENGKTTYREMNANDAIRFHADQLARGDVKIVGGEGKGQTLADWEGVQEDTSIKVQDSKGGRHKGKKYDPDKDKGKGGGKVTIEPSPALAQLLRFTYGGNVVGQTTPPNPYSRDMPTGNPKVGP